MKEHNLRTPPVTPASPDTPRSSASRITSLQSIISHHYLNSLAPPQFNSKSFIRNTNKRSNLTKSNFRIQSSNTRTTKNPGNTQRSVTSSQSHDNQLTTKSLIDFRNAPSAGFSSGSFNSRRSNVSSGVSQEKRFHQLLLPKYLIEEKNAPVNNKTDLHQKIIEIGETIYDKIQSNSQSHYELQMIKKEAELKVLYDQEMESSVEKERSKFLVRLESMKAKMKSDYEKILKEKADEIEAYTKVVSNEHIEAVKVETRKTLTDTVEKLQNKLEIEKNEAIDRALKREALLTGAKLEEQKKFYEKKIDDLNENWLNKLKQSNSDLRAKLTKDAERQFTLNNEQLLAAKNEEIDEIKVIYERELDTLRSDYSSKKNDLVQMRRRIDMHNYENEQLKTIVHELRMELKNVIEHFSLRNGKGVSEIMLEPKSILKNPKILQKTSFKL